MFRNSPVAFILALLLAPLGIGLVILLFWWLKCLATSWTITSRRTVSRHGLLSKFTTELRHVDIRAIHVEQGFFQRLMGTGTIRLSSSSSDDYEIEMRGVAKPEEVAELLRGLQENRNIPEQPVRSPPAPLGANLVSSPVPASQMQQNSPLMAQRAAASDGGQGLGSGLPAVGGALARIGTQAGPWAFAAARKGWAYLRTAPGKIDPLLKFAAGEGNDVIYRFFQVVAVALLAAAGFGMLVVLWLASWLWCSVPCLAVILGIALLLVGGKTVERSRAAGGGMAVAGLLLVLLGLPSFALSVSSSIRKHRHENEIRQANDQVASLVRIAQGDLENGDLDKAEDDLRQATLVPKAGDTEAVSLLQGNIQMARQEAAVGKANRTVREYIRQAESDFLFDRLEAAEAKLTTALAVQGTTEMAKAKELLAKIPARRQQLANEKVTKLMADATESFKAEDFNKAMQTVNEAIAVNDATNTGEAEQLLDKMGDARPDLLARDAMRAIQQRRYPIAAKRLRAYLVNPRSDRKPVATQVLKLVEILLDADRAQASLKTMSDAQLKVLSEDGKLPDDLATSNKALTEAVKATLVRNIPQERNRRQAEERERLLDKAKQDETEAAQLAEKAKQEDEKAISYEVIKKWGGPPGRFGMDILVSETAARGDVMSLANSLMRRYHDKYLVINIFDSREAWRHKLDENEVYSEKEYFRHFLVQVWEDDREAHRVAEGRDH